jgi:hypothetical protein
LGFWIFAASYAVLAWALRRFRVRPALRFSALLLYGPAVLALTSFWFGLDLVPQANRYHLEMDLAVWMLVALFPFGAATFRKRSRSAKAAALRSLRLEQQAAAPMRWLAVLAVLIVVPLAWHQHRLARALEAPIDIQSTSEYKISHWLDEHLPGRRVFAPGSVSFWMDAFSDTPMLPGGFDNGITNQTLWDVNFQILFGDKLPVALAWLKAYGCDAIVGDDFNSHEIFHPYSHPDRLHSLPELWRDGPDVIYAVPRHGGLAHAIRIQDVVRDVPLGYETKAIDRYVAALDEPTRPKPNFQWRDPANATIHADLDPDYLLSVQVTWDKGWKASAGGMPRRIWGDKLGQIVVEPQCEGPCTVELSYDGGFELRFACWACILALASGAVWILWQKFSGSATTK